jgi:Transglycosylase SLT domain
VREQPSSGPAPLLILASPLLALVALIALVIAIAFLGGSSSGGCGDAASVGALDSQVPPKLVPLYQEAAAKFKLGARGPAVLAAINFVETSFGQNMATSSAGANGWMAFMPETWAEWGVDGDGDGDKDPYSADDAIFSAANYLHDSGAPGDWWEAIFAYNHAAWYVEKVLRYEKEFSGPASSSEVQVSVAAHCSSTSAPNEQVAKMVAEADRLSGLRPHTDYVYGGSHGVSPTPADGPFDCSSAVSHILQVAGFGNPTMDTIALLSWADRGPGEWVTIFDKPYGLDAHTFFRFDPEVTPPSKRYWGTSGMWFSGHGPGWIPQRIFSASYLSGFVELHPPGL